LRHTNATGASLVIEPFDGVLKINDNPLGVMTNAPSFDWHMTNLRNYLKISPYNVPPLKVDGQTFAAFGQRSGLQGIPGDPTPPSRFLRALGYTLSAEKQTAQTIEPLEPFTASVFPPAREGSAWGLARHHRSRSTCKPPHLCARDAASPLFRKSIRRAVNASAESTLEM
jgi:Linear amide C-N hydrolases, choloylglycine hydrolase family